MRSEDGLFALILSVLSFFVCDLQTRLHSSVKWNNFWTLFRAPVGSREDKLKKFLNAHIDGTEIT